MKINQPARRASVIVLFIILSCTFKGTAQTLQCVTLNTTTVAAQNMSLQTNQVVSLVGYDWIYQPAIYGYFPNGNIIYLTPFNRFTNSNATVFSQLPQTVTGLTNILMAGNTVGGIYSGW